MPRWLQIVVLLLSACLAVGQDVPFSWHYAQDNGRLTVTVDILPGHYLYQQQTELTAANARDESLLPETVPESVSYQDMFFGDVEIYDAGSKVWVYDIAGQPLPVTLTIDYLGCRNRTETSPPICFAPATETFTVGGDAPVARRPADAAELSSELSAPLSRFNLDRAAAGLMNDREMLNFLQNSDWEDDPFAGKSVFLIVILIIAGGISLNLTPCILPLIPVNLTIIGAGVAANNKRQGFIRGAAYGAGIALAYGGLGLAAVMLGARFGSLNSSPWFNFAVAAVFAVLGLAMFDLLLIDFSKYGGSQLPGSAKSRLAGVFFMGIVSALLAGACVAPVVIAVLLYSAKIYSEGVRLGLLLPFLLGFAMALPWPFAGAGIAVIPKPGAWMARIKHFFGAIIFIAAVYYGYIGYSLLPARGGDALPTTDQASVLKQGLQRALRENKPVFIDFWATWCKNCLHMEATTFKEPQVQAALENYVFVKFQAENMRDPAIKPILDYFQIRGLPSFVILSPK